jgi:hypothetical protein
VTVNVSGTPLPKRQIALIFRKNRKQPRAVMAFFQLLVELYRVSIPEAALSGAS